MNRHRTEVRDWMTPDPITILPTASLLDAHGLMIEQGVRRLPVVVQDNELVGIITLTDIQGTVTNSDFGEKGSRLSLDSHTVNTIMAETPVRVNPDDLIQDAAEAMLEYQVSGLPVVQGSRVVGIITESDIFRLVVESWTPVMAE